MGINEEIAAEQDHLDLAYQRLEQLRAGAAEMAAELLAQGRGGLVSDRVERDARIEQGLRRRAALSIGDRPLCFGRIDRDDGERLHVGRLGVLDVSGDPLVIDWRTPAAEAFYRATPGDRRRVRLRRHIRMKARTVVGVDDESLSRPSPGETNLVGEGALLAALATARTGRMGDIVATIQAEQDRAIRSPLQGVLVVQGGPGTGKTAVALHRAAYLLYAHHFPLASQGVLVVGPNPVFCRYVEDVLPGLGETGVRLATVSTLGRWTPRATDAPDAAALKGSLGMVEAMSGVIGRHHRRLEQPAFVGLGIHRLAVTVNDSRRLVSLASEAPDHRHGRAVLERELLRHLLRRARQAAARAERSNPKVAAASAPSSADIVARLRRSPEVAGVADQLWPKLSGQVVADEALEGFGLAPMDPEALSDGDVALLEEAEHLLGTEPARRSSRQSRRPEAVVDEALERTLSSLGMLPDCPECGFELTVSGDEARCEKCGRVYAIGQVMSLEAAQQLREIAERVASTQSVGAETERAETFGHVIVDEAQDLSPLQWRMLARRCPSGSMTIVGDLGQAKHAWSARDWSEVAATAAPGRPVEVLELHVNYRTPAAIMELAAGVLAAHNPVARPPISVRRTDEAPRWVEVGADGDLDAVLAAVARHEIEAVAPGKVAIVRPPSSEALLVPPAGLDQDLIEIDVARAQGLEFDSVVVVEPAAHSLPELYVALTRSTRRLVVVSTGPLPDPLRAGLSAGLTTARASTPFGAQASVPQ